MFYDRFLLCQITQVWEKGAKGNTNNLRPLWWTKRFVRTVGLIWFLFFEGEGLSIIVLEQEQLSGAMLLKNISQEEFETLLFFYSFAVGLSLVHLNDVASTDWLYEGIGLWSSDGDIKWPSLLIGWSKVFVYSAVIGKMDPWPQFFLLKGLLEVSVRLAYEVVVSYLYISVGLLRVCCVIMT